MRDADKKRVLDSCEKAFTAILTEAETPVEKAMQIIVHDYIGIFATAVLHPGHVPDKELHRVAEITMDLTSDDSAHFQHDYPISWTAMQALKPAANQFLHHGIK